MKRRGWIVFLCTQAAAVAAMVPSHIVPDRFSILGYLLLLPGLAAVFGVVGNRLQGSMWDALFILLAIVFNAGAWQGVALGVRALGQRKKTSN